jgi:GNAT superfamily N-acetyltransferase
VDDRITVAFVPAETTWSLRQQVLRPRRAVSDCIYPGEDDQRAAHAAAWAVSLVGSTDPDHPAGVLAVGVVMPEAPPWDSLRLDGWRLRGMATRKSARGQGLGSRILDLLIGHVASQGGGLLWCNARTPALHLYERAGFRVRGDVFEIPEIGPHQVMGRTVAATP